MLSEQHLPRRKSPKAVTSLFSTLVAMSTLADELLNDFEDSGSEGENEQQNGFLQDSASPPEAGVPNGHSSASAHGMMMDVDEEDGGEDEETADGGMAGRDAPEDEEEAKAKVEKMQLGGVNDVRNVAGLMKTLEPVLEVGHHLLCLLCSETTFTSPVDTALTFFVASRKSQSIKLSHLKSKRLLLAPSKIIPSTTFSRSRIHFQRPSIMRSF